MSIREALANSIDLEVINEYDKDALMQISTVLRNICHAGCP